jgi:hypothetical protein
MFSRRSGLFSTAIMAIAFYFLFMRGRGGGGSANWGSSYLFWIVAPVLFAAVSSHPAILLVVVVGLVARRWLPDPFLTLSLGGRVLTRPKGPAMRPHCALRNQHRVAQSRRAVTRSRKKLLDRNQCPAQGDLVMSSLRQPTKEPSRSAIAAPGGCLFGGQDRNSYGDCVKGSRTNMPISRVLEHKTWRGG